jgi:hypothetical protein
MCAQKDPDLLTFQDVAVVDLASCMSTAKLSWQLPTTFEIALATLQLARAPCVWTIESKSWLRTAGKGEGEISGEIA